MLQLLVSILLELASAKFLNPLSFFSSGTCEAPFLKLLAKVYGSRNNHARRFAEIPAAVIGRSKKAAPAT